MKKITLLVLLMWASLFYGQTYLDQDFEGSFLPTGWVDQAGSTDVAGNNWLLSTSGFANPETSASNSGTQAAFFNDFSGVNDRWLISPVINLSAATSPELTYYEMTQYTFYADIGVYYSTDYTGDPTTATWVALNLADGADAQDSWTIRGAYALPTNATVYIGFNYKGNDDSEWYVDDVLVRETPTCVEPSSGSFANITASTAEFSWTSGPGGTETQWDIEVVVSGNSPTGTPTNAGVTSNPYTLMSLSSGTIYDVYVRADCGGGDTSIWSGSFSFSTVAGNDDCSGATSVAHESGVALPGSATATSGTINGATGTTTSTCSGGTPNNDVWFSFVATSNSATVLIEASATFDVVLEVYDACGGSQLACEDSLIENQGEEVNVHGLTQGNTYYVRVYDWYSGTPANGDFSLKVYRNTPLDIDENDNLAEFKFYPNPVQDKLNLRAQDNIQKISVYNMLGQEVLRQAPNNRTTEVDMSALQTGSYFVKVTINGLTETKQIIKR